MTFPRTTSTNPLQESPTMMHPTTTDPKLNSLLWELADVSVRVTALEEVVSSAGTELRGVGDQLQRIGSKLEAMAEPSEAHVLELVRH